MPPQKAMQSSMTTIFWWCEAPGGCIESSLTWMRRCFHQRISTKIVLPRKSDFSAPKSQRSRKTSSAGSRFTSHRMKSPILAGAPSPASPMRMRASKSQPISMIRRRAFIIAARAAAK